jgi:proteasome lid subunit RPN8/RPN11
VPQALEGDAKREAGSDDSISMRVSSDLLAELCEASASSLDRERADFLVGRLVQEPDGRATVVLLTRIPAGADTGSSLVHFSFSPQTFQAAQRELERRGSEDMILGWHHNHPPPCGHQCLMTIPPCRTDNVAFSMNDRIVHRSAFGRPYMVALVSGKGPGKRADDPVLRAYGWQRGRISERTWSVFERTLV